MARTGRATGDLRRDRALRGQTRARGVCRDVASGDGGPGRRGGQIASGVLRRALPPAPAPRGDCLRETTPEHGTSRRRASKRRRSGPGIVVDRRRPQGSIYPMGRTVEALDRPDFERYDDRGGVERGAWAPDAVVLEEPEHLNWYSRAAERVPTSPAMQRCAIEMVAPSTSRGRRSPQKSIERILRVPSRPQVRRGQGLELAPLPARRRCCPHALRVVPRAAREVDSVAATRRPRRGYIPSQRRRGRDVDISRRRRGRDVDMP